MAKEVDMSVRDTIDLDAALTQFIKDKFSGNTEQTDSESRSDLKEESK